MGILLKMKGGKYTNEELRTGVDKNTKIIDLINNNRSDIIGKN